MDGFAAFSSKVPLYRIIFHTYEYGKNDVGRARTERRLTSKITAPRLKILQLLESTSVRHVSAEDVYKLLLENGEEIGLATVYRVLTQFEDAGLVARHHLEGYLQCSSCRPISIMIISWQKCGKVEEFNDVEIERRQKMIAESLGFELTDHDLNMGRLCPVCR